MEGKGIGSNPIVNTCVRFFFCWLISFITAVHTPIPSKNQADFVFLLKDKHLVADDEFSQSGIDRRKKNQHQTLDYYESDLFEDAFSYEGESIHITGNDVRIKMMISHWGDGGSWDCTIEQTEECFSARISMWVPTMGGETRRVEKTIKADTFYDLIKDHDDFRGFFDGHVLEVMGQKDFGFVEYKFWDSVGTLHLLTKAYKAKCEKLMAQCDDDDWKTRDNAEQQLRAMGIPAALYIKSQLSQDKQSPEEWSRLCSVVANYECR